MSTRDQIDRVRVLLARVDEAEKALDAFDNIEIPNRRDVLIRRVDAARDELIDFVAKPEEAYVTPPLATAMKTLRFALPDGKPVVFCPKTPPLATSETVDKIPPCAPLKPVAETSRCRAGCRQGDHPLAACPNFARFGLKLRVQLVRSDGLCYRCLDSGHVANACPSWAVRCGHLTRNGNPRQAAHHVLLHGVVLDDIFRR